MEEVKQKQTVKPKKGRSEPFDADIRIRCHAADKAKFEARGKRQGFETVSDFARFRLFGKVD